jgi:outer membrane protein assembly factor BamD (BamD/ComL family)
MVEQTHAAFQAHYKSLALQHEAANLSQMLPKDMNVNRWYDTAYKALRRKCSVNHQEG